MRLATVNLLERNLDGRCRKDSLLSPLVLATDLVLLLGCEVILNVKCLADFLWRFPLDHVGNGLAANIEKCLDIKVVGRL